MKIKTGGNDDDRPSWVRKLEEEQTAKMVNKTMKEIEENKKMEERYKINATSFKKPSKINKEKLMLVGTLLAFVLGFALALIKWD